MGSVRGPGDFSAHKYLSLETYRRSGAGVRTPVWFVEVPGGLGFFIYAAAASGKAKRIRLSGRARIAPCNIRGRITGDWIDAHASIVGPDDFACAMPLLNGKYWPWKRLLDLLMKFRPGDRRIVIAITPQNGAAGGD